MGKKKMLEVKVEMREESSQPKEKLSFQENVMRKFEERLINKVKCREKPMSVQKEEGLLDLVVTDL